VVLSSHLLAHQPLIAPKREIVAGGEVTRHVLNTPETLQLLYDFLTEYQQKSHGTMLFAGGRRESFIWNPADRFWMAVARIKDRVEGVMLYRITGFQSKGRLVARHLYALSVSARYLLLQFVAKHTDQVNEIALGVRADEHVELWLPNLQHHSMEPPDTFTPATAMYRVVLVLGLNGLPSPLQKSHGFVANILDANCSWNNRVFQFKVEDHALQVHEIRKAEGAFDLSIQGLSALICCGYSPEDVVARGWSNVPQDAWAQLEQMFPRVVPHLHEWF